MPPSLPTEDDLKRFIAACQLARAEPPADDCDWWSLPQEKITGLVFIPAPKWMLVKFAPRLMAILRSE